MDGDQTFGDQARSGRAHGEQTNGDGERASTCQRGPDCTPQHEDGVEMLCLARLADEVQRLVALLKRQRTAMARRDTRLLSQILAEEEELVRELKELATSEEGARVLAATRQGVEANPTIAGLYRRLVAGLLELIAINRANQEFLIAAQQAIRGALCWHPGFSGAERMVSYTRRGRIAV